MSVIFKRPNKLTIILALIGLVCFAWSVGWMASLPLEIARLQSVKRNNFAAQRWLERARLLNPRNGNAAMLQARLSRRANDFKSMERHLDDAANQGASAQRIVREKTFALAQSGHIFRVEAAMNNLLADPQGDAAEIADCYVSGLILQGRLWEANTLIQAWMADASDDPKPWVHRAKIAIEQLDQELAIQEYRNSLAINENFALAHYGLGIALLNRREPDNASKHFERCMAIDPPTRIAASIALAACERLLGKRERALEILQPLRDLDKETIRLSYARLGAKAPPAPVDFELGLIAFDEQRFADAVEHLRMGQQAGDRGIDARTKLAMALARTGHDQEARTLERELDDERAARQVIRELILKSAQNPNDASILCELGTRLLQLGNEDQGLHYLNKALSVDAEDRETLKTLIQYLREHENDSPYFKELATHHEQTLRALEPSAP